MCQVKFVDLHHRLICPQSLNFTAWSFNNSSINQLPFLFDLNVEHYFKRLDLWYFCHRLYREWCPVVQLNGGINRQCKSRLDKQSKSSLGNSGRLSKKKLLNFLKKIPHTRSYYNKEQCMQHAHRQVTLERAFRRGASLQTPVDNVRHLCKCSRTILHDKNTKNAVLS